MLNLTSQVNGGAIAELRNAEGRDSLCGRPGILFCPCYTGEAYPHLQRDIQEEAASMSLEELWMTVCAVANG